VSRPIIEPGVPLGQARQGYDIRQLQRRPARNGIADFGTTTQQIYLPDLANVTNGDVSTGVGWNWDFTTWSGGYVTRATSPADGDHFSFMALLSPAGSIWQFSFTYWIGPSYGKLKASIASLGYELVSRPSGCPAGKIQPWDAGYGDALNYVSRVAWLQDCYNAAESQALVDGTGLFQVIPGGDIGAPLTDLTDVGNPCANGSGNDPYTAVNVMDGGPGWYRIKMNVEGKNASSSGFKFRVSTATLVRLDDDLAA